MTTVLILSFVRISMIAVLILSFVLFMVMLALAGALCFWKILEKAGRPGWKSVVPIYNVWQALEISGKPGALALLLLAAPIPVVGMACSLTVSIILGIAVAKSFGKDGGYAVGLVLLGIVFYPIIGFGDATYIGPNGVPVQGGAFPVLPPQH